VGLQKIESSKQGMAIKSSKLKSTTFQFAGKHKQAGSVALPCVKNYCSYQQFPSMLDVHKLHSLYTSCPA
jgi:hypothetical protein